MLDFRRKTLLALEKCFSVHKITIFSKNFGVHGPFAPPPDYAYERRLSSRLSLALNVGK